MARTTTRKTTGPKPLTIPRKPPRLCGNGHRVAAKWRPGDACWQCVEAERARAMTDPAYARSVREAALAEIGPLPDQLVIRSGDGKSVQVHRIPRGLRPGKRRRHP